MKKILFIVASSLLLVACSLQTQLPSPTPQPSASATSVNPSASTSSLTTCAPSDLHASMTTDPAAGNIYATFMLKNISTQPCQIIGDNYITPDYDFNTIDNISVTHTGSPEASVFELQPGQTIYSQAHYPNGPQCSGQPKTASVGFKYQISPADSVVFDNDAGPTSQQLQICTSPAEITEIQVWNMSTQPITPQ